MPSGLLFANADALFAFYWRPGLDKRRGRLLLSARRGDGRSRRHGCNISAGQEHAVRAGIRAWADGWVGAWTVARIGCAPLALRDLSAWRTSSSPNSCMKAPSAGWPSAIRPFATPIS